MIKIDCVKRWYHRTPSGKGWSTVPYQTETETDIPIDNYRRYCDSVSWFNSGSLGESCRAYRSYNALGYCPYRIVTVGPYRETKIVADFSFEIMREV